MKKILLIIFTTIVSLLFSNNIEASFKELENNEYAAVICQYGTVNVTAISNGIQVNTSLKSDTNSSYVTLKSKVSSSDFIIEETGLLECPNKIYYTVVAESRKSTYTYSFKKSTLTGNILEQNLDQNKSYNNKKQTYNDNTFEGDTINCAYPNNINIKTDGVTLVLETDNTMSYNGAQASDFINSYGELFCPDYKVTCTNYNNETICSIDEWKGTNWESELSKVMLDGSKYKKLLGELRTPLEYKAPDSINVNLTIDGNANATLASIDAQTGLCDRSTCSSNIDYYINQGLMNIKSYCNDVYVLYLDNKDLLQNRVEECNSFSVFYRTLVESGYFEDLNKGCEILPTEFQEKLTWILDLIKIAGPIAALGLGTLDFIKAIASGDADKEMKTAFKRFSTRLIAAALLFLVPIIVAFLLDTFLGNQEGYNEDNPFCNVVEWK